MVNSLYHAINSISNELFVAYNRDSTPIDMDKLLQSFEQFVPIQPNASPSVIKKINDCGEIVEVNLVQVNFVKLMRQCVNEVMAFAESLPGFSTFTEHDKQCLMNGGITELLHIKVRFEKIQQQP